MSLSELLAGYAPYDEDEAAMVRQLQVFLAGLQEPQAAFGRELAGAGSQQGHVIGSAWVINDDGSRAVLVHHAKLNRWVQPGGHCDGEGDVFAVARREAREETRLDVMRLPHNLVAHGLFDVDVHRIPEYWNTLEHLHYDVRFLLQADAWMPPVVSAESRAVRWVGLEEALALNSSPSIARMIAKTRTLTPQLRDLAARYAALDELTAQAQELKLGY